MPDDHRGWLKANTTTGACMDCGQHSTTPRCAPCVARLAQEQAAKTGGMVGLLFEQVAQHAIEHADLRTMDDDDPRTH